MNATATTARRIIKARRAAIKDTRKGLHTLASHARKAGLDTDLASGVAGALRGKAKTLGITGKAAVMVRPTAAGARLVPGARRYTEAEFQTLVAAYAPRAPKYVAARQTLLAAV